MISRTRVIVGLLLVFSVGCNRTTNSQPASGQPQSVTPQADNLIAEFKAAQAKLSPEDAQQWGARMCEFAEQQTDSEEAIETWQYVMAQSRRSMPFREAHDRAVRSLVEKFPSRPETAYAIYEMHGGYTPGTMPILESLQSSEDEKLRTIAKHSLACRLRKKDRERSLRLLNEVADLEEKLILDGRKVVDVRRQARQWLFELQHLQIGMAAPETVGTDLEGVEFRLSDYRGKVVLLTFWGDW